MTKRRSVWIGADELSRACGVNGEIVICGRFHKRFTDDTEFVEALPHDSDVAVLYEELRALIDGGSESMTHEDAVVELKALVEEGMDPDDGWQPWEVAKEWDDDQLVVWHNFVTGSVEACTIKQVKDWSTWESNDWKFRKLELPNA